MTLLQPLLVAAKAPSIPGPLRTFQGNIEGSQLLIDVFLEVFFRGLALQPSSKQCKEQRQVRDSTLEVERSCLTWRTLPS